MLYFEYNETSEFTWSALFVGSVSVSLCRLPNRRLFVLTWGTETCFVSNSMRNEVPWAQTPAFGDNVECWTVLWECTLR